MSGDEVRERMTELAPSFPCLRKARGVDPFETEELNRWAASGVSHREPFLKWAADPWWP